MPRANRLLAGLLLAPAMSGAPAFTCPAHASDHIDGPATTAGRAGDLTDLYAFPTPGRAGFLSIVLDAYPLVPADGSFSDEVRERIVLRRATLPAWDETASATVETFDERTIECGFERAAGEADPGVSCLSSNGLRARAAFAKEGAPATAGATGGDFRLWAGMRSDPFFLNTDFFEGATEGRLVPPENDNVLRGANVLAIVIELDLRDLFGDVPGLLAVAAETTRRETPGGPSRRLDRVGRPEITNVSLTPRDRPDLRDRFNVDTPYPTPNDARALYRERLAVNVAAYDALDGKSDWLAADRDRLATLFADDFLLVDPARPCADGSFLEIERAILRNAAHQSCGGRRPADDVLDVLFTLYVSGLDGPPVRDGVDGPASPLSDEFPHLAPPDLAALRRLRVYLARKLLGIPEAR